MNTYPIKGFKGLHFANYGWTYGDVKGSGVYGIININNGKLYIGSAVDLKRRERAHIWDLTKDSHCNNYLQNAFNKYGQDSFFFIVFEYCKPKDLIKIEQRYLDDLTPEYNILKKAYSSLGFKHTPQSIKKIKKIAQKRAQSPEWIKKTSPTRFRKGRIQPPMSKETIEKIRQANKGRKHSEKAKEKMSKKAKQRDKSVYNLSGLALGKEVCKKKVNQLDMNGNYIKSYNSVVDAKKDMGGAVHINDVCNGLRRSCYGFKWEWQPAKAS